jgi:hypothetical protein
MRGLREYGTRFTNAIFCFSNLVYRECFWKHPAEYEYEYIIYMNMKVLLVSWKSLNCEYGLWIKPQASFTASIFLVQGWKWTKSDKAFRVYTIRTHWLSFPKWIEIWRGKSLANTHQLSSLLRKLSQHHYTMDRVHPVKRIIDSFFPEARRGASCSDMSTT